MVNEVLRWIGRVDLFECGFMHEFELDKSDVVFDVIHLDLVVGILLMQTFLLLH